MSARDGSAGKPRPATTEDAPMRPAAAPAGPPPVLLVDDDYGCTTPSMTFGAAVTAGITPRNSGSDALAGS